jgi:hypothetical protein
MSIRVPTMKPNPAAAPDWERIWVSALQKPHVLSSLLRSRRLIGYGSFGAVYNVSGVAVKIGCVPPEEAERQDWVQKSFHCALPVLAYGPQIKLPEAIARRSCPIHGLGCDPDSWYCHCGEPMDILVMPLARYGGEAWFDRKIQGTISQVQNALFERFHFFWEEKPSHLMIYDGRVVLADFGEEEVDRW